MSDDDEHNVDIRVAKKNMVHESWWQCMTMYDKHEWHDFH